MEAGSGVVVTIPKATTAGCALLNVSSGQIAKRASPKAGVPVGAPVGVLPKP